MVLEFKVGIKCASNLEDTTTDEILKKLKQVNCNLRSIMSTLTDLRLEKEATPKNPHASGAIARSSLKQLNFILQYQVTAIEKEIAKENARIEHILAKIEHFPDLVLYIGLINDGCHMVDIDALKAYNGVDLSEVKKYCQRDQRIMKQSYPERSIELMRQLIDPKLNSKYYQILNNPKSTLQEKNEAVMKAYAKYGNFWTQSLTKKTLTELCPNLGRVCKYHFRNLKPRPKELYLDVLAKKETHLNDVNHLIYKVSYLPKLLQAKQDYVKYLIRKCHKFLELKVAYGVRDYGRYDILNNFIVFPDEMIPLDDWYEVGIQKVRKICKDENYFLERYFDFTSK